MTYTSRRSAAVTVIAAVAAVIVSAMIVSAGPASAHTALESSDPANGASLAAAPSRITLTFEEAPQANLATITVVGPDGRHYEQGAAVVTDRVVSVGVAPLGTAGGYRIGYRVLADDGHPSTGELSFTMTTGSPAAPGPAAAPAVNGMAGMQGMPGMDHGGGSPSGMPSWPFVVAGLIVVVGAAAYVARRRSVDR